MCATYPAKSAEGQSSPLVRKERHGDIEIVQEERALMKKKCEPSSPCGAARGPIPQGGGGRPELPGGCGVGEERDSQLGPIGPAPPPRPPPVLGRDPLLRPSIYLGPTWQTLCDQGRGQEACPL